MSVLPRLLPVDSVELAKERSGQANTNSVNPVAHRIAAGRSTDWMMKRSHDSIL